MKPILLLLSILLIFIAAKFSFGNPISEVAKTDSMTVTNDTAKATIMSNMQIRLDTNALLAKTYKADISHLTFSDQAAAEKVFNRFTDNLVFFEVNISKNELIIQLYPEYNSGWNWSVAEWNLYLEQKINTGDSK